MSAEDRFVSSLLAARETTRVLIDTLSVTLAGMENSSRRLTFVLDRASAAFAELQALYPNASQLRAALRVNYPWMPANVSGRFSAVESARTAYFAGLDLASRPDQDPLSDTTDARNSSLVTLNALQSALDALSPEA